MGVGGRTNCSLNLHLPLFYPAPPLIYYMWLWQDLTETDTQTQKGVNRISRNNIGKRLKKGCSDIKGKQKANSV